MVPHLETPARGGREAPPGKQREPAFPLGNISQGTPPVPPSVKRGEHFMKKNSHPLHPESCVRVAHSCLTLRPPGL